MRTSRLALPILALALALGCAPKKPPILVITTTPAAQRAEVQGKALAVGPLQAVELKEFKKAFEKKYGTEEVFKVGFVKDLQALLPPAGPGQATWTLELTKLHVDEETQQGRWVPSGVGPTGAPMGMSYVGGESWAVIRLDFRVVDPQGNERLEARATSRSSKGEFLHPKQGRLANAVAEVQRQVVDFVTGKMPEVNVVEPGPTEPR